MKRWHSVLRSISALTLATGILTGIVASPVFAATAQQTQTTAPATGSGAGNGMKVSPVHTELNLKPGQSTTVDVFITNVTGQRTTFQAIVNDFVASGDESGNPAIILDPSQSAPSHGLKQYINPISNVTLDPGQQADIKAVINLPANVAPGGYYGAVRFAPAAAGTSKNVSLSASVASLILVRVAGTVKEQVSIAGFDATVKDKARSFFTSKKDINASVRFQNEGNIQEQPFGKITLKNSKGKVINSTEINSTQPQGNVLPDSIRRFSVPLNGLSSFGKYKLEGDFGYGNNGQLISASTTFYIVPVPIIVTALILLALIIAAIFEVPRFIKRYNKRVLRKAGR